MLGEEFIDDFAEELVGYEGGVLVVGDDDAADAFGAAVRVKGVVLFFNILSLPGLCSLGDCLGEEGHEFAIVVTGEAGVCAQFLFGDDLVRGLILVADDANVVELHDGSLLFGLSNACVGFFLAGWSDGNEDGGEMACRLGFGEGLEIEMGTV